MAATISYSGTGGYIALNSGSKSLPTLPTGQGVIIMLQWDYSTAVPTFSGFSLSTDGAPTDTTAAISAANGSGIQCAYWPSLTTASQTISLTNSGSYSEGMFLVFTVSGHSTSAPFGRESTDTTASTLNFTFDTTGDALLAAFWGTTSTTLAFSEGTWSNDGAPTQNVRYWSSNLTAESKSITITNGVPGNAAMVEIVAGGTSAKPAYYYAQQ